MVEISWNRFWVHTVTEQVVCLFGVAWLHMLADTAQTAVLDQVTNDAD